RRLLFSSGIKRGLHLCQNGLRGGARVGSIRDRPSNHQVVGSRYDCLRGRGLSFLIVFRVAVWPDARRDDQERLSELIGKFPNRFRFLAGSDYAIAASL